MAFVVAAARRAPLCRAPPNVLSTPASTAAAALLPSPARTRMPFKMPPRLLRRGLETCAAQRPKGASASSSSSDDAHGDSDALAPTLSLLRAELEMLNAGSAALLAIVQRLESRLPALAAFESRLADLEARGAAASRAQAHAAPDAPLRARPNDPCTFEFWTGRGYPDAPWHLAALQGTPLDKAEHWAHVVNLMDENDFAAINWGAYGVRSEDEEALATLRTIAEDDDVFKR